MIYRKLVLLVTISILLACHNGEKTIPLPDSDESPVRNETPTPEPKKYEYIKEEGWQIPSPTSKTVREKKVILAKTVSGKPVKVNSFTYTPRPPIISPEPLKDR